MSAGGCGVAVVARRAAGEEWQTGWRFFVWSVVGLMGTLVALLLFFSFLGKQRPPSPSSDSTTTGGLGLLNSASNSNLGDADLIPRTGSVLSALSAVSAAASDVTRASIASEAMFVPPKGEQEEEPAPRRGWLDW